MDILAIWNSAKAFIIGGAVLAIFFLGYHLGADGVQADWDKEKNAQTIADQTATLNSQRNVIMTERKGVQTTYEVSHDFQLKKDAIDSNFNAILNSMQGYADDAAQRSVSLPGLGESQPRPVAAACADGLSGSRKKAIALLMKQADIQTQQLLSCQAWIRQQGMAPEGLQSAP